jgi:endonuclease/exonuclease/phosphatase family metal-dependent hydrolase
MRSFYFLTRSSGIIFAFLLSFSKLPAQSNTALRIMSANLNGNTQSYQPFAIRILQGLKPDIVAIQEFNYSNNTPSDIRAFVDAAFGTDFAYFREDFTGSSDIPNGIISRYPIIASGSWPDSVQTQPNRGYAWAQIALPGTNTLYIVSVHLLTSSATARADEATNLKALMQSQLPQGAWVVLAGDFNTDVRTEAAMVTFDSYLSDNPVPTDAEVGGNSNTSINRNHPHDYVLPAFSFTNLASASVFASHSFSNGLVFDSRVYTPLSDVAPVLYGDSSNAQHMAVLKDFLVPGSGFTNPPGIVAQPQSVTVQQGGTANFTVSANGTTPLSFQWRLNGMELTGATTTSFSITNVQPADAGDYSVVVTNSAGSATSTNATLTVDSAPAISAQPQSQAVNVGQTATFTVSATGAAPLAYQWRFFSTNLPGATATSYSRTNAQTADAGNYSVVITNTLGSVTSLDATLTVVTAQQAVIAQWNFNSTISDTNVSTGVTTPSIGAGTASLVGGTTATFATGDTSVDPVPANDNSGWNTTSYPAAGTGNKTAGVQFNASTVGRQNIVVTWSERVSNTGSKYVRLQYTTNGTTFADFQNATAINAATVYEPKTNSLAAVVSVNNNPNFGIRIVAEFESTAANTSNTNYVGAAGTYGTGGTVRFDMVTISGSALTQTNPPPVPATLSAPIYNANHQFQLTLIGQTGSNYVVQASTNLSANNWVALQTNAAPFNFTDTNAGNFDQRFYRAVTAP